MLNTYIYKYIKSKYIIYVYMSKFINMSIYIERKVDCSVEKLDNGGTKEYLCCREQTCAYQGGEGVREG